MDVTAALVAVLEDHIHIPADYPATARAFSKFGFPNTVGAMDATHIQIQAPKDHKGEDLNHVTSHLAWHDRAGLTQRTFIVIGLPCMI